MRARLVVFLGTGVGVPIAKAPRMWPNSQSLTRQNYFFKRYDMQLVILNALIDRDHTHTIVAYGNERCASFSP